MARITKATKVKVALILLLCFVLCFGLVSCSSGCSAALRHATGLAGGTYAGATYSEQGDFSISADIVRGIDITWLAGGVDVRVQTDEDEDAASKIVAVEEYEGQVQDDARVTWQLQDGILKIGYGKVAWGLFGCADQGRKHLSLTLPKSLEGSLESLSLNAASGDYNLNGFLCKTMDITLASGNVTANEVYADNVILDVASGHVKLLGGFEKNIDVDIASGDIGIDCLGACPKIMDIDMMSGRVDLGLPHDSGFAVDLDKVSGNFGCSFNGQWEWSDQDDAPNGSPDIYIAGDGTNSLSVNMTSGNVNVYPIDEWGQKQG